MLFSSDFKVVTDWHLYPKKNMETESENHLALLKLTGTCQ